MSSGPCVRGSNRVKRRAGEGKGVPRMICTLAAAGLTFELRGDASRCVVRWRVLRRRRKSGGGDAGRGRPTSSVEGTEEPAVSGKQESCLCRLRGLSVPRYHRQESSEGQYNGSVEDSKLKAVADGCPGPSPLGRLHPDDRSRQGKRSSGCAEGDQQFCSWGEHLRESKREPPPTDVACQPLDGWARLSPTPTRNRQGHRQA